MKIAMLLFTLIFGLGIALAQTVVVTSLWKVNLRPKWLLFLLTPLILWLGVLFLDDDGAMVVLLVCFMSIFLLFISGVIYSITLDGVKSSKKNKTEPDVLGKNPQTVYLNPAFGILYQIYILVILFIHIFVPNSYYDSQKGYDTLISDFTFQVGSVIFFTVLSGILIFTMKLKNAKIYLPTLFSGREFAETEEQKKTNRLISYIFGISLLVGFLLFCYSKDFFNTFILIFKNVSFTNFFNLNIGIVVFVLYNLITLMMNPVQVAKQNLNRLSTLLKGLQFGVFAAAACVPLFIVLDSKLDYFNMSSEIVLFLGFNLVMLMTEIMLYIKKRRESGGSSKQ